MQVIAKLRYLRIAPRKVRQATDLIRGKKAEQAKVILNFTQKRASRPLIKLLSQGIANAKNNFQLDPANLFISKISVDEGPKYKRWRARSRGQAHQIQKKTSHITLVLDEIKKTAKKKKKLAAKAQVGKEEKKEVAPKVERPKLRPELETKKPKTTKGLARIFRRKVV